jgi:hypothetical protein
MKLLHKERLKEAIIKLPCICLINYKADLMVFLVVDTSMIAVGYLLSQQALNSPTKQYPSRFRSIILNETESSYSQSKLELYRLFHALHATCIYTIRVKDLVMEVDVKYIH